MVLGPLLKSHLPVPQIPLGLSMRQGNRHDVVRAQAYAIKRKADRLLFRQNSRVTGSRIHNAIANIQKLQSPDKQKCAKPCVDYF
jgi:hypothetical protein